MHWLNDSLHRRTPLELGLPWLTWRCVEFLDEFLRPGMRVFEYGGGGSTLYFARKGCRLVTVEGYRHWSRLIRARLDEAGDAAAAVEIREIAGPDDGEPPQEEYVRQVHYGGPWELILVDGAHRLACLEAARDELQPNGVLLFDNADLEEYREAPKLLPDFERRCFSGLGVGRRWATQTDVYRRVPGKTETRWETSPMAKDYHVDGLSDRALLAAMLDAPSAGPSDPLIGRTWRLSDTGHEFTVLAIGREDVQILDGRTTRFIPTELLIAVWEAHELEEVK
jgi:hypothetical protein